MSECRVLMVVDRPKEKSNDSKKKKIQEAAKPHRIKVRSGALTVLGGRYFRQTDQRADWIGCSSLKACFDENAGKQPLDHLGRRLLTLLLFFSSFLFSQPHKRGTVGSVVIYLGRQTRASVEMVSYTLVGICHPSSHISSPTKICLDSTIQLSFTSFGSAPNAKKKQQATAYIFSIH